MYKNLLLIILILFISISFSDNLLAIKLSEEYVGKIEAGGTDFDMFVTEDGKEFSIYKKDPEFSELYNLCSYDNLCKIEAHVEDYTIYKIYSASNLGNDKGNRLLNNSEKTTNDINNNIQQKIISKKTLSIFGVELTDSYDKIIQNGINNGYNILASIIPKGFEDNVMKFSGMDYLPLPIENLSLIPGTNIPIDQDLKDIIYSWYRLEGNRLLKKEIFSFIEYRGNKEDIKRSLVAFFFKDITGKNNLLSLISNKSKIIIDALTDRYGQPKKGLLKILGGSLEYNLFRINKNYIYFNDQLPNIYYYNEYMVKKFIDFSKEYKKLIRERNDIS